MLFSTFQRLTGRWRVQGHGIIRRRIVITCLTAVKSPVFTLGRGPAHTHKHCKYTRQHVCACVLLRVTGHSADGGNGGTVKLGGCCHKAEDGRTISIKRRGSLKGSARDALCILSSSGNMNIWGQGWGWGWGIVSDVMHLSLRRTSRVCVWEIR